jgi:hypothetical protein
MKKPALFIILSLIVIGSLLLTSMPIFAKDNPGGKGLEKVREALENKIFSTPGFAGIGHSEDRSEIIVFMEDENSKREIPDVFEGFTVRKMVTGRFEALGTQMAEVPTTYTSNQVNPARLDSFRPLRGGISVSAYLSNSNIIYAGTLGMVTYNNKILTNTHVIAMDPANANFLSIGTPVIQEGSIDGGNFADDYVGTLSKYVSLRYGYSSYFMPNYVDAAIATPVSGVTNSALYGYQFLDSGGNYKVSGSTTVSVGSNVRKSGRTSGVTTGIVSSNNASTVVYYSSTKWAYYKDQILVNQTAAKPFIQAGDSGSCVDLGGRFVGLAFAGSDTQAVVCKASRIVSALGISVGP